MESRQREQIISEATAESGTQPKAEWITPEVNRLIAGGAEAGGSTSTDAVDVLS